MSVDYRGPLVGGIAAALGALVVGWAGDLPAVPLFGFALVLGALFALGNLVVELRR